MNVLLIVFGFIAIVVGAAVLAGFPGYLLAGGFALLFLGLFGSIEGSLRRLAKRWAPE